MYLVKKTCRPLARRTNATRINGFTLSAFGQLVNQSTVRPQNQDIAELPLSFLVTPQAYMRMQDMFVCVCV